MEKPLDEKDVEQLVLGYHRGTREQLESTVQQLKDSGGIDHFVGQGIKQLLEFLHLIFG